MVGNGNPKPNALPIFARLSDPFFRKIDIFILPERDASDKAFEAVRILIGQRRLIHFPVWLSGKIIAGA